MTLESDDRRLRTRLGFGRTLSRLDAPTRVAPVAKPWAKPLKESDAKRLNGPVIVKQPPAGRWRCDSCGKPGQGGVDLLEHSRETELKHLRFTPLD